MNTTKALFDFIEKSPTPYHATNEVAKRLLDEGFTELYEMDSFELKDGGKYFLRRNGTSLIAFKYKTKSTGFNIVASHSDNPTFKVKGNETSVSAYSRLSVEKYGGMIYYSWLDRPLSVAGRLLISCAGGLESRLVNIDTDLLTIPSLAIHLNRAVNDGWKINPAKDMLPLYSNSKDKDSFIKLLADTAGVDKADIVSHDLYLYNREEGRIFGAEGEFVLCPRLDDLGCVYSSLEAFVKAENERAIPVLAIFDNEEVGSETKQGAASTFLSMTLSRIAGEEYFRMLSGSFMVSADNAHAKHPNSPEMSDAENAPIINNGIVIKFNANQRYATDGLSYSVFKTICQRAGVPTQTYYNRADLPGGSTLGTIADTTVSIPTVDIGLPQLAMHSATETAGVKDVDSMVAALTAFYATPIVVRGNNVVFPDKIK